MSRLARLLALAACGVAVLAFPGIAAAGRIAALSPACLTPAAFASPMTATTQKPIRSPWRFPLSTLPNGKARCARSHGA